MQFKTAEFCIRNIGPALVKCVLLSVFMPSATAHAAGYVFATCSPGFEDISTTGTAVVWLGGADDNEFNVSLPFSLTFYDTTSTAVRIGSNGGILFDDTAGTHHFNNQDLPSDLPGNTTSVTTQAILPFWDDLNPAVGGNVYYQTLGIAPNRRFLAQWDKIPHYFTGGSGQGDTTFQAVLYEGSNNINFVYDDVDFGSPSVDNGASATVGLNNNASEAHKFSFNTASLSGVDGVCFIPTTGEADVQIVKTATPSPVSVGQELTYILTITNNGPDIATDINVADALPGGVTWVSTTPSQGACSAPSGVACELGDLAKDASATVTIKVTVN